MNAFLRIDLAKRLHIFILILIISTFFVIGGYSYFRIEDNHIRTEKNRELKTIAELKSNQIRHWFVERTDDARFITKSPLIINTVEQWLKNPGNITLKKDLKNRMTLDVIINHYENIFLVSDKGKLLLSAKNSEDIINDATKENIITAVKVNKISFPGFFYSTINDKIHFDIIAPVTDSRGINIAAFLLRIDPDDYIYPLIQSMPVPRLTSETIIVRKEGNNVLYLNELKFMKNSALKLEIPLTQKDHPAVKAVLGYKGFVEGHDYRGVEVLAYVNNIPGTSLFIVSKIDKSEIYEDLYFRQTTIIGLTFFLILITGLGFSIIYKTRQKKIFLDLYLSEKELWESQEEFKTTLYSIGDAVITTDVKGYVNRMNPVAEMLTGWREIEAKGRPLETVFRILSEETNSEAENPVIQVLREGVIVGLANHSLLISKDGKEYPIADSVAPIRNEDGVIIGVILVFRDQTEARKAQKMIEESESYLKEAQQIAHLGHWQLDIVNNELKWSDEIYRIFGVEPQEFGASYEAFLNYVHPDDRDFVNDEYTSSVENRTIYDIYHRIVLKDGTLKYVNEKCHTIYDDKGKPVHSLGTVQDITLQKKAEEELQKTLMDLKRSNEELEQFAYIASHDLQEPLRMISSFTQLLEKRYKNNLDSDAFDYINFIVDGAQRMQMLINDLLEYSRVGSRVHQFKIVNSASVLNKVKNNLQLVIEKNSALITNDTLPVIMADENLLIRLFQNLIDNAIKFKGENAPQIHISSVDMGVEWKFMISDNGIGFSNDYRDRIFIIFQRLHNRDDYPGTGIGLAVSKRIVEKHGGRIWCESEPGKGSVFYFTLHK
ncbi:MAG: PAS domain-containing protein [Ignavibacteriae bacterium]|nr:PAS domain-containing protein [Ignavibacteriota bacterium]